MTGTDTSPVWGSWKTHGHKLYLDYFGTDRKAPAAEGIRSYWNVDGNGMLVGQAADGDRQIFRGGVASRFWAVEVPAKELRTREEVRHHSDGDSIAVITELVPAPEPAPAPAPKPAPAKATCHDGCGLPVNRGKLYRQGHDARHVKQLFAEIVAGADLDDTIAKLVHAPRLQAKLTEQVKRRIEKRGLTA